MMRPSCGIKLIPSLIVLLLGYSVATVNRFAPENLNADIILHSIMSLTNVSLFYWEQNRLANVLAFMWSPVGVPHLNLFLILLTIAATHYAVILLMCLAAKILVAPQLSPSGTIMLFVVFNSAFLCSFNDYAIYTIAVAHWEQTFPVLVCGLLLLILAKRPNAFAQWWFLCVGGLGIATGVNFASVVIALAAAGFFALYKRKIDKFLFALFCSGLVSGIIWFAISKAHGSAGYGGFLTRPSGEATELALTNIVSSLDIPAVALTLLLLCTVSLITIVRSSSPPTAANYLPVFVCVAAIAFSLGWFLVFSNNDWVTANNSLMRYFIPSIYAASFVTGVAIVNIVSKNNTLLILSFIMALGLSAFRLWAVPVPVEGYKVFRQVQEWPLDQHRLYAGDYWKVWPAVFYSILSGGEPAGLAYRGSGNSMRASQIISSQLEQGGFVDVLNLGADEAQGVKQVSDFRRDLRKMSSSEVSDDAHVLRFQVNPAGEAN